MTDLIVDRMHVRAAVNDPDEDARVRSLLTDLAGRRLEEALASSAVPPGEWCVRRLDVSLTLDQLAGDAALGRRWAYDVTRALIAALADGGPEVVHYARPADAVADMIASLALGITEREWAWRAAAALTPADPDPAVDPAGAALAALERDPTAAVHVLSAAVQAAGLPAVHRLLTAPGWQRAAAVVLTASGRPAQPWLQVEPSADDSDDGAVGASADPSPVVAGILARSPFARAWRRSRLRPSSATVRAWAVLAAAEAEPALLRRPIAAQVLAALPAAIDPTVVTSAEHPSPTDATVVDVAADSTLLRDLALSRAERAAPPPAEPPAVALERTPATEASLGSTGSISVPARSDTSVQEPLPADVTLLPPGPRRPEEDLPAAARPFREGDQVIGGGDQGFATVWGGLVHLFATAAEAGLPDEAFADPDLAARPSSWILFHLAHAMTGYARDGLADPSTRVVAGLPPQALVPTPEPRAGQRAQLALLADRWARVTAQRLDLAGQAISPQAVVTRLVRRSGTVRHTPGWIEFELRLSDVDLDVRRAGLDLDPGFVAWLGAVVVIRYA